MGIYKVRNQKFYKGNTERNIDLYKTMNLFINVSYQKTHTPNIYKCIITLKKVSSNKKCSESVEFYFPSFIIIALNSLNETYLINY